MLITCHDTCHTHTLHMSICVQAGVVPFAPTQAQDRPATLRANAAGTGGVVSGRQRASADRVGWEIIAQSAHVHLAFKVQTRVHVSHVLRELTRQRQDLLAHRVWPANTEVSLAEFPRPRAVTARTIQILGRVAMVSADIRATTVLCVNILALIRLRLYSCTSSLSSHVGWVLNDCTTCLTCKLAQQSACLGGSTWPESKHLREVCAPGASITRL